MLSRFARVKAEEVARLKSLKAQGRFPRALEGGRPSFRRALAPKAGLPAVIAEYKRASPSKGLLREDLDAVEYARDCEDAGAVALSVLTERNFFQGSVEDLQAVREAVKLPVLRKDFIIDPYQVPRSYGTGADAILVIVRAVPDDTVLRQIFDAAENLRLDVLTEVWDEKDAERALRIGADSPGALRLVGINSRDLATFETDLKRPAKIAKMFPETPSLVCLSGVKTRADVDAVRASSPRLTRFLVGEALVTADDPYDALKDLLEDPSED